MSPLHSRFCNCEGEHMSAPKVRWIVTAEKPKTFTMVWLWDSEWYAATLGFWDGKLWRHYSGDGLVNPSHWAELVWPKAP